MRPSLIYLYFVNQLTYLASQIYTYEGGEYTVIIVVRDLGLLFLPLIVLLPAHFSLRWFFLGRHSRVFGQNGQSLKTKATKTVSDHHGQPVE